MRGKDSGGGAGREAGGQILLRKVIIIMNFQETGRVKSGNKKSEYHVPGG